jgi:hypothetical protein
LKVERSARKEPLSEKEVRALLAKVTTVIVGKGKKATTFKPKEVKLSDLQGRTGNYRAPMALRGKTLVVGFSPEAYDKFL